MKAKKIFISLTAIALLALTIMPVFANGSDHWYRSCLYAGRDHVVVGYVEVNQYAGNEFFNITYVTENGWYLVETHVAVADSYEGIPQTKSGNPKVGHFQYAMEHDMIQSFTYENIPEAGHDSFIATHAVVYNECTGKYETAWGQGENMGYFLGNNWAIYFTFPYDLDPSIPEI